MIQVPISDAFKGDMRPPTLTVKFAKEVGHLSRVCGDLPEVLRRLQTEVDARVANGRSEQKFVTTIDVQIVRKQLVLEKGAAEPATPCQARKRKRSDRDCSCDDEDVLEMVLALNYGDKSVNGRKVFEEVMHKGVNVLCCRHVRTFAGDAVGLLNSHVNNNELRCRLQKLYDARHDWQSSRATTEIGSARGSQYLPTPTTYFLIGFRQIRAQNSDSMHVPFSNVSREREAGKHGKRMGRLS
jgi:hypothetical protein